MQNAMGIEFENHKIGINKWNFIFFAVVKDSTFIRHTKPIFFPFLIVGLRNRTKKSIFECIKIDIFIKKYFVVFRFANTLQSAKDAWKMGELIQ